MWDEREWLNGERAPARSVRRSHPGYHRIYFPSQKNHHNVLCEGALEAAYCVWLEWDADVRAYYAQPHTFRWRAEGRAMRYTPDFFVQHRDSANHFTEVKYDFTRLTDRHREKLASFSQLCRTMETTLKLADRQQLVEQSKFKNLRYLYFRSLGVTQREQDYLTDYLNHCEARTTIRAILSNSYPPTARSICHRLFSGESLANLDDPLTLDTQISQRDPL
ncbi:hypothetical protein BLL42_22245 [Pseudomonas frederiksbergensis]|uniref:TnsA endonuclease N-terminal domain-containing protein n=1 Tax=Pseudomonas frederiksbergensis TaxID=104087 RepID=A0A1J0EQ77_9PSED|nr:TnsA endonuclease N-terminal domain-containing protein [Pseudomonas frederiksbergensis]APC18309.1 hypothetical protein BLL42_22245 [Pseudomonas frederiksbergensis]